MRKIEIRQHRENKVHAKVYICRFKEDFIDYGRVITGSNACEEKSRQRCESFLGTKDNPIIK